MVIVTTVRLALPRDEAFWAAIGDANVPGGHVRGKGVTMKHVEEAEERWGAGVVCCLGVWFCLTAFAFAGPTVRISESGEALELEYPGDGGAYRDIIPLYRSGQVRYFSAGVGIEERSANYPSFPLKVVFTAGGRPYVAGVSVTVRQGNKILVTIPRDHVTGPWLFLDAPDGSYHIAATVEGLTERLKDVKVKRGKQKTVYLRWPEDRGQPGEVKGK